MWGGLGSRKRINETRWDLRETNHKRLLISQNKLRVARGVGRVGRGWWGYEHWEGMCLVSAVKCVNLAIHRPVPLGLIIHYMLIKKEEEEDYYKSMLWFSAKSV